MKLHSKILYVILFLGCLTCLVQVWWPHYYLTGDGPCHLYNAKILHDFWNSKDIAFYSPYYRLEIQPDPNWLTQIIFSLLLYLFDGPVTEKLFITLYAALMAGGLYLLLKKISADVSYWPAVVFLLVFHHTLAKGFYNYSIGVALYSWVIWCWLRFMDRKNTINALAFFLFSGLIFFSQLLPFVFAVATCALLVVTFGIAGVNNRNQNRLFSIIKNLVTLGIITAPFLALMEWFTHRRGGLGMQLTHHFYRLIELVQLKYFVSATHSEDFFAAIGGVILMIFIALYFIYRIKNGWKIQQYDGFFFSLVFVLLVYLFVPENFMGGVILITMRVQLFVVILAICCIANMVPAKMKNAGGVLLFGCFLAMSMTRFSCQASASEGAGDIVSASQLIRPYSVVLPLDFAPGGKDIKGKVIADRNYLFSHAAEYTGGKKPLIFLDNYEANMGYFPLIWTKNLDPYSSRLSCGDGLEAQPPCADIFGYESATGVKIDYVILWCYDSSFPLHTDYARLARQIDSGYHKVYATRGNRTILYERNK